MPLTTSPIPYIFQPSNQLPTQFPSSLDPNQMDHRPLLSILLPCSPFHITQPSSTSIALTNSYKTPAKKPFQKFSNSPKKTKHHKPLTVEGNPYSGPDHKLLNKKRTRLSGELLPHKRGSRNFQLSALSPDEKEILSLWTLPLNLLYTFLQGLTTKL